MVTAAICRESANGVTSPCCRLDMSVGCSRLYFEVHSEIGSVPHGYSEHVGTHTQQYPVLGCYTHSVWQRVRENAGHEQG